MPKCQNFCSDANRRNEPTEKVLIPILVEIASLKVDQQYTVPIEQCIKSAGMAALNHLLFNFFIYFTKPI